MRAASTMKSGVSVLLPRGTASSRFMVSAQGPHCIVGSTVLGWVDGAMQALSHCGTADADRILIGEVNDHSDTVLIAWAAVRDVPGGPLVFRLVRNGLFVTEVSSTLYVAADVPSELVNVSSAYVLCFRVRASELQITVPPAGAIISIASISRWVMAGYP